MKIWVSANQKAGVGKTTTAVSVGAVLARAGAQVLLVDLDPHGSLTTFFGQDPDRVEAGGYASFQRAAGDPRVGLASLIEYTRFAGLALMPASTALAAAERQLAARQGMGPALGAGLRHWARRFDYAIIDCPPMLGMLLVNLLTYCDHVIVPVQCDYLALKGYQRFTRTLEMVARARGRAVPVTVVATQFDRRTRAAHDGLRWLIENAPDLWSSTIPLDTQFREAARRGVPLPALNPGARGALAYAALVADLALLSGTPPVLAAAS